MLPSCHCYKVEAYLSIFLSGIQDAVFIHNGIYAQECTYLKRRASRSHSRSDKMSPSRTGPFTLRMIEREGSSRNSTRTWVTLPVLPVRPKTRFTLASFTGWSILDVQTIE